VPLPNPLHLQYFFISGSLEKHLDALISIVGELIDRAGKCGGRCLIGVDELKSVILSRLGSINEKVISKPMQDLLRLRILEAVLVEGGSNGEAVYAPLVTSLRAGLKGLRLKVSDELRDKLNDRGEFLNAVLSLYIDKNVFANAAFSKLVDEAGKRGGELGVDDAVSIVKQAIQELKSSISTDARSEFDIDKVVNHLVSLGVDAYVEKFFKPLMIMSNGGLVRVVGGRVVVGRVERAKVEYSIREFYERVFLPVYCNVLRMRNPGKDVKMVAKGFGSLPLLGQIIRFVGEDKRHLVYRLAEMGYIELVGDIYGEEARKVRLKSWSDLERVCS